MKKYTDFVDLLKALIQTQSLSGQESGTASIIEAFFERRNISTQRIHNNIIAKNQNFKEGLPLIVLNSHHDTVALGDQWTYDPLGATIDDGRLYGRGSNDAGGPLVGLIAAFCELYEKEIPYNLMIIASGEEENFGDNGVKAVLHQLALSPSLAIIGEPTSLSLAVAEKGLIVIDAQTKGISGHAARDSGTNALYLATEDIEWIKNIDWQRESDFLGRVKTTVTQISSGYQHNVIPDLCSYVIDCRVNEHYTLEEVLSTLDKGTHATLKPRSLKWRPNGVALSHPIVLKAKDVGLPIVGSPTLSDQVHFTCPSVKIGPGDSKRSHTADEYIYLSELYDGIQVYCSLLENLVIT